MMTQILYRKKKQEGGNKDKTIFFYLVITNTSLTVVTWAMEIFV